MDRIKKIISVIILISIIVLSIYKVSFFLQLKESDNRYSSYLVENTDIDVLFLGSSHVRHGFFPMELWSDYGISSFNLAANGSTIPVSYWVLVNALDYQTPQVVVMDVFDMFPGRICSTSWGQVHIAFDFFPISINKYKMVNDLFDDTGLTDGNGVNIYQKRWELLWNIGEYHSRWTDLTEIDFKNQKELEKDSSIWKGAEPLTQVVDRCEMSYPESSDDLKYDELSKEYLIRMIDLCREKGIDIVLINTGYDCNAEAKLFADSVYDIAAQYDVPYLDFTKENIINFASDISSTGHNTHVNFSGAEKLTSYMGGYLLENYLLPDHRYDVNYSSWWSDYRVFADSKKDYLISQNEITNYLMFLADDDYQIIIEVKDMQIFFEGRNQVMFENLDVDYCYLDNTCNLILIDNEANEVSYLWNDNDNGKVTNTSIGNLRICYNADATKYSMYLNEKELYSITDVEDSERIRISVIRKSTGDIIDSRAFN